MKNSLASQSPARLTRLAVAATLLTYGTVDVYAQTAPTSQDVQALAAEIRELKSRLAAMEAKLAVYQAAPVVPATKPKPAVESEATTPAASLARICPPPNLSRCQASAIRFRGLHLDERPEPPKVTASLQLLCNGQPFPGHLLWLFVQSSARRYHRRQRCCRKL